MNKYIATASILGVIALASCKKYIAYNPHDSYLVTAQDYLQSESDYRTMEVSVYTPLQWMNQMVPIGDIASDNAVSGGESASDVLDLQQIDDYTLTPVNGTLAGIWQYSYEGVNRANYMMQYREKNPDGQPVDFAGKDALYGEVYFLRAFYYFSLVKMFGDVPLFIDKRLDLSNSGTLKRVDKAAVYLQVESDLNNAISALPAVQVEKGRITKGAAQALLGKAFLYQNKYDSAATVLQSVINAGTYSLVSDFASMYLSSGENGPESIFEIQYSNASPYYQWSNELQGQGNYAVQQAGIRNLNGSAAMPYAAGWSTGLPTQDLAAAYSAGDQRKTATLLDIEAYKNANPGFNITYQVAPYKNTGLYNGKLQPHKGETSGQPELNYENNFRILRYSDVLLMAAEALNKQTSPNDALAQTYLNQVRRRAFQVTDASHDVTATGSALYTAILNERRLELAMEGERFFDLVRTGQAATVLGSKFQTGKNELFPIPDQEIKVSGLTQNPGY